MKVLERLLLSHLSKQVNIFGTHSLLIALGLVLKMPPSTCFSEPTLIWTKQAALWGSCSLIYSVLLKYFSLYGYVRSSRWMPPQPPGLLTAWQTDHSLKGLVSEKEVSSTGSLHSVHLRLPVQLRVLTSPEILWWLCRCWVYQWWTRGWVQGTGQPVCGTVWEQSLHLEYRQNKWGERPNTVSIWEEVEVVGDYRYQGVYLKNIRGGSLGPYIFCQSVVERTICSAASVCGSSIRDSDREGRLWAGDCSGADCCASCKSCSTSWTILHILYIIDQEEIRMLHTWSGSHSSLIKWRFMTFCS